MININIDAKQTFRRAVDKVLSARFIITLALTFTFCWITMKAFDLLISNIGNEKNLPIIEKVVFFLLGSFCTKVGNVITSYFDRSDRTNGKEQVK